MKAARSSFTPCTYGRLVFLPFGFFSYHYPPQSKHYIEVFHLDKREFYDGPSLSISPEMVTESVAVIEHEVVTIITNEHVLRVGVRKGNEACETWKVDTRRPIAASSLPVMVGRSLLWVQEGKCVKMSLEQPFHYEEFS